MSDCIFCKIVDKEIPADIVYEDDKIMAFKDLLPQAPVHVLIVTKKHIPSLNDLEAGDLQLIGHLMMKIREISEILELDNGYRLVNNYGEDGMQTVDHVHFHLLGKRKMGWPPG